MSGLRPGLGLSTHGRWPWAAAGAVLPATALTWRHRAYLAEDARWVYWLAGPALLWHQTEEWVWPGGFLPWVNTTALGGSTDFPITPRAGFGINVGLGWGLSLASGLFGPSAPDVTTVNLGLMAGNIGLHGAMAVLQRRYNPGLATATGLFLPFVLAAVVRLDRHPSFGPARTASGVLAGLAVSAGAFWSLRIRAGGGKRPEPPV